MVLVLEQVLQLSNPNLSPLVSFCKERVKTGSRENVYMMCFM